MRLLLLSIVIVSCTGSKEQLKKFRSVIPGAVPVGIWDYQLTSEIPLLSCDNFIILISDTVKELNAPNSIVLKFIENSNHVDFRDAGLVIDLGNKIYSEETVTADFEIGLVRDSVELFTENGEPYPNTAYSMVTHSEWNGKIRPSLASILFYYKSTNKLKYNKYKVVVDFHVQSFNQLYHYNRMTNLNVFYLSKDLHDLVLKSSVILVFDEWNEENEVLANFLCEVYCSPSTGSAPTK